MARGETHHGAEVTAWELADLFYAGDETALDDEPHQEQCCSGTVRCALRRCRASWLTSVRGQFAA